MKIILASASARRAALLEQIGLQFITVPSNILEEIENNRNPDDIVCSLAREKGLNVATRHSNSLIIAADTIVVVNQKLLGKPAGEDEARYMLSLLSGQTHAVFTGVYTSFTGSSGEIKEDFSFSERTNVTFSSLDESEIEHYVKSRQPYDKAGSYGIQDDLGALFVEKIDGDFYNVVGFPLNRFYRELKKRMPAVHKQLFSVSDFDEY